MPEMPECVGNDCRYIEFSLTKVKAESWNDKQPTQTVVSHNVSPEMQNDFDLEIQKRFAPIGKGCGKDCVCKKTEKILSGPTIPETVTITITIDNAKSKLNGFEVNGTYTYTITVYAGICGPLPPKKP
jgi:hypothetical protein